MKISVKPLLTGWILTAACTIVYLSFVNTAKAQDDGGDSSDLSVTIDKPSDSIVYDDSDNAYVLIGDDSSSFSFDCTVDENPSGTFYYTWNFGSGDPSTSDRSEDSDTDPVSFDSPTQVTVNVEDDLDDGTVCASGSDSLTVSQVAISYDVYYQDDDPDDRPIYFYIDDDADADDEGNLTVKADLTISTNECISSGDLGSLGVDGDDGSSDFVDDDGNSVTEAETDDSGMIRVTLETSDQTDPLTVEIN